MTSHTSTANGSSDEPADIDPVTMAVSPPRTSLLIPPELLFMVTPYLDRSSLIQLSRASTTTQMLILDNIGLISSNEAFLPTEAFATDRFLRRTNLSYGQRHGQIVDLRKKARMMIRKHLSAATFWVKQPPHGDEDIGERLEPTGATTCGISRSDDTIYKWSEFAEFWPGMSHIHFVVDQPHRVRRGSGKSTRSYNAHDLDQVIQRAASLPGVYLSITSTVDAFDSILSALPQNTQHSHQCALRKLGESADDKNGDGTRPTVAAFQFCDRTLLTSKGKKMTGIRARLGREDIRGPDHLVLLTGTSRYRCGFSFAAPAEGDLDDWDNDELYDEIMRMPLADGTALQNPPATASTPERDSALNSHLDIMCQNMAGLGLLLDTKKTTMTLVGMDRWDLSRFGESDVTTLAEAETFVRNKIESYMAQGGKSGPCPRHFVSSAQVEESANKRRGRQSFRRLTNMDGLVT